MRLDDPLYGPAELDEVLARLLESGPVQRLKGISQYGIPSEFHIFDSFSRYEHSVGVMLLLRRMDAPLEAQAAGLLHDTSHTAFSHVADWVFGRQEEEDYHDDNLEEVIEDSEIPSILEEFGMEVSDVTRPEAYPLLEREIPELCADRVDYALREMYYAGKEEDVETCIENLTVHDGIFIFSGREPARIFAEGFLERQREHWGHPEDLLRFYIFARILETAVDRGIISVDDFYRTDYEVIEKLEASDAEDIHEVLDALRGGLDYETGKPGGLYLEKKFRHVDPLYLEDGDMERLSRADEEFRELLERERRHNEEGFRITLSTPLPGRLVGDR